MSTPSPGRRAARGPRRPGRPARPRPAAAPRRDGTAVAGAGLALLAGALLVGAQGVEAEPEPGVRPTAVPVDRVDAACASFPGQGPGQVLTLAAPLDGVADTGSVEAGPVGGRASEVEGARGRLQQVDVRRPRGDDPSAVRLAATDGAAVGRATFQVDAGDAGRAVQECLAPRSRWWFTGGGAGLDHASVLVLANIDPGPAVVDVRALDAEIEDDTPGVRGLTVQPGEVRVVDLLDIAPQAEEMAVSVEAGRGRVVAALADSFATRPASSAGAEWVPAQTEPSRVVRLGPLPRDADRRTLVVGNPAGREALVEVRVAGESGSFTPEGLTQLRVPPGAVVTADLGEVVGEDPAAVVLRSPVRLTATVRTVSGDDVAYAAVAPLLGGPAAALVPRGLAATVTVTAGDQPGTARAVAYSADGEEVDSAQLEVSPTATVSWRPERRPAYVVLTPGTGRLFGGVSLTGDDGVSAVPFRALPTDLRRPAVVPVVR